MANELRGRKVVAHEAGVSPATISRWIRRGILQASKPGGATSPLRVERADLAALMRNKKG